MMRSRAVIFLFLVLLSTPISANDDYAEEMIPPPLDLDMRGTSLLWAGSPHKQAVALTFDDGPIPGKTTKILEILKEHQAFGTFFVVGSKVSEHPELIQQVIAEGHEVGNHTQSHRNLTKSSVKEIRTEIKLCQDAVNKAVGFRPTLFRAPYGAANMTTFSVLSHFGLTAVFWSIDTRDWAAKDASTVTQSVIDHVQNGDVILFHEHSSKTVSALPGIIQDLQKRGFVCVTISQLFDRPPAGPTTVIASAKQSIRLPVVKTTPPPSQPETGTVPDRPVPDFVDMAPPEPEAAVAGKLAEEPTYNGNGYAKPESSVVPVVVSAAVTAPQVIASPAPTAQVEQAKAIEPVLPTATPTASLTETRLPSPTPTFTETETPFPTITETPLPTASPTTTATMPPTVTVTPTATSTIPPTETATPSATLPPPTATPSPSPTETPVEIPTTLPVVVKATPAGQPSAATKTLPLAKVQGKLSELSPVPVKSTRPAAAIQSQVTLEGPDAFTPPPSQGKPIAPIPAIPNVPPTRPAPPAHNTHEIATPAQGSQPPLLRNLPAPPPTIETPTADDSLPKRVRRLTPVNHFKETDSTNGGKGARRSRVLTPFQEKGAPPEGANWGYSEQPGT